MQRGVAVSFTGDALFTQTPAPLKLPSEGGKLEEWWAKSQADMNNTELQKRLCAGGAAGDAGWRGACAEFVSSSSITCNEECRHLRGGSDEFGDIIDDSVDACAARDEQTCYNVCLDDKLFDAQDVVQGNGTRANPPCNENQTAAEMNSVRKEKEDFWNHLMDATTLNAGDSFWMDEREWKAHKKAEKQLQSQFDDFWVTVCKADQSKVCDGVLKTTTKKTFLSQKHSESSRQLVHHLHSKISAEAYKSWLEASQFPGAMALSAICRSNRHPGLRPAKSISFIDAAWSGIGTVLRMFRV